MDLLTLNTKVIMSSDVVNDIRKAESTGSEQFTKFCHERLENNSKSFYDPIPKNKLKMFKSSKPALRANKKKLTSA